MSPEGSGCVDRRRAPLWGYFPCECERESIRIVRGVNAPLIIVAPGKLDKLTEAYIQRLRTDFNIPIWYLSYSEGDPLPAVFVKG